MNELSPKRNRQCVIVALDLLRSWCAFNGDWEMIQARKLLAAALGGKASMRGMTARQAERFKREFYRVRGRKLE